MKTTAFLLLFTLSINAQVFFIYDINTDKGMYTPSDTVHFTMNIIDDSQYQMKVQYFHLADIIDDTLFTISDTEEINWSWIPPVNDFQGYLTKVSLIKDDNVVDSTVIAVDVSSDWCYYPRYGFVSKYHSMSKAATDEVLERLTRYHINGIQFYDWLYKHHMPLKGTVENPANMWYDIANRLIYASTVRQYIDGARQRNMKSMAYNLLYGAYDDMQQDGVMLDWRLFRDKAATTPSVLELPDGWRSDIFFMNTNNENWKTHIYEETRKALEAFNFDGWHIDQLGDWGIMYDNLGNEVNIANTFEPFTTDAKEYLDAPLVLNAVNQYGQSQIAKAPVDFLYTEVWEPNDTYRDLVDIIHANDLYGDGKLKTVLAAYVNQGKTESPFNVNAASLLLADAVIFSFGASHIEIGEHLLAHPYYPNDNARVPPVLEKQLISYYDFHVAYENLLRDSLSNQASKLTSEDLAVSYYPPKRQTVWTFSKEKNDLEVHHLINFLDVNSMDWKDNNASQIIPSIRRDIRISLEVTDEVKRVWVASPDTALGVPMELSFEQNGNKISFNVPYLKYWDLLVIEYGEATGIEDESYGKKVGFQLNQNFPNPFNAGTEINYSINEDANVELDIYDSLGQKVGILVDAYQPKGNYSVNINNLTDFSSVASGIYYYKINVTTREQSTSQVKKMIYLR